MQWQLPSPVTPSKAFLAAIQPFVPGGGMQLARILWQRGWQDAGAIAGFLHPANYLPTSPFAFGQEMEWAVDRILTAAARQEIVAIWGDFDADGLTATAVLWEGLGHWFVPHQTLFYYIPHRITESHGLSQVGLDRLHQQQCRLIITCDTGSTNRAEIDYARSLGMAVIVTDHHTLPDDRPPVTAILNPRVFPPDHPLASLSGVAVAYKLMEALDQRSPQPAPRSLDSLLDLVAIGLIADLVDLKGDGRYLAQRGLEQLQKQSSPATCTRPGVGKLLDLCKRNGDRPTDISFGLAPRINAISRIQGNAASTGTGELDAHFCVELLTSQDVRRCNQLAEATELANTRRKALQKEILTQVKHRIAQLDLSTTGVIVLADEQWHPGILGLVAGQIAQEYGRPTILLSLDPGEPNPTDTPLLARGSARSVHALDLYQLVQDQSHLLHRFGGHPCAAGLSLPVENLPLFTDAINQRSRLLLDLTAPPTLAIDLEVTVADLGKELFQELKLLEPCGMGNPVPRLLIRNLWFTDLQSRHLKDRRGQKVQYIKTELQLWDETVTHGFPGVWWGHYPTELPAGRCDGVVELDRNTYQQRYEVRLIEVRVAQAEQPIPSTETPWLLDWRGQGGQPPLTKDPLVLHQCPKDWHELQTWYQRAKHQGRSLALAYPAPTMPAPEALWQTLAGMAKYLSRTGKTVSRQQILEKLPISDRALELGIASLQCLGLQGSMTNQRFQVRQTPMPPGSLPSHLLTSFLNALREEHYRQQYFFVAPLAQLQAHLEHLPPVCTAASSSAN